jgi:hypothetical protein
MDEGTKLNGGMAQAVERLLTSTRLKAESPALQK